MLYPKRFGSNPLFPQKDDFSVVLKNSMVGYGVIAHKRIEEGELVAAICGDIVNEVTQHSLQIEPGVHFVDKYFSGYFLHSCDPNVSLDVENMMVHALKDIEPGEFLFMDYAQTEDYLFKQFRCHCGADTCRGWITGRKEAQNLIDHSEDDIIEEVAI